MTDTQLNEAVAVKVFGWTACKDRAAGAWVNPEEPDYIEFQLFNYLTWAGIGLIVEKMREKGYYLLLDGMGGEWSALFSQSPSGEWVESCDSLDAPHAVALAALKALEGK